MTKRLLSTTLGEAMESDDQQRRTLEGTGTVYCIVVCSEIGERFALAFEGMKVETKGGQTVLTGEVIDQSHLHGILGRIGALGLKLVSIESVPQEPRDDAASCPPTVEQRIGKDQGLIEKQQVHPGDHQQPREHQEREGDQNG
jgi:hypothetical protein